MRFRLRTLLILMAVLPPMLAWAWWFPRLVRDLAIMAAIPGVPFVIMLATIATADGALRLAKGHRSAVILSAVGPLVAWALFEMARALVR